MQVDKHYKQAALECLTPDAAARYIAGDMDATDEAGHDLIAATAGRLAEQGDAANESHWQID